MLSLTNLSAGLVAALLISQSSAHFLMVSPASIGFDDDAEGTAPCGSFTVDFSANNVSQFHAGGDAIALRSTHPDTKWLFRATIGTPITGNLTSISQVIEQSNIGTFCRSDIKVPQSFVGKNGTIAIAANGPDGVLYQCAAVSFVAGKQATIPSVCTNSTGVTASYVDDTTLAALPATYAATTADSPDATTSTSPAPKKSSSAATANGLAPNSYVGLGQLAWVAVVGSATFLACLL